MDGLLLLDKSQGWTSFDVVNKTRSLIAAEFDVPRKKVKVGHTGTLDPMATGLLVLTVGSYCKRASEWAKTDKTYEAQVTLGAISDTDDAEGQLRAVSEVIPDDTDVHQALLDFEGKQSQIPPAYSAIKIGGQRAYKRARDGQPVELQPREVSISSIKDFEYEYPRVNFTCTVSSGTYIRAIARDLGSKLGTGGYLSALRRTSVGQFSVSDAVDVETLSKNRIQKYLRKA